MIQYNKDISIALLQTNCFTALYLKLSKNLLLIKVKEESFETFWKTSSEGDKQIKCGSSFQSGGAHA